MNRKNRTANLFSQLRSERDFLLALLPTSTAPIRRIDPIPMPDSGLCPKQQDPATQWDLPPPLRPSPGFFLDHLATGAVVLVVCVGLSAPTVLRIALSTQHRLAAQGTTGVYLVSCTDIGDLVAEGFTVEVLPESDPVEGTGVPPAQSEFMSFVLAKYCPTEVIDLGAAVLDHWPAPSPQSLQP
jgi:hypothetical protein